MLKRNPPSDGYIIFRVSQAMFDKVTEKCALGDIAEMTCAQK